MAEFHDATEEYLEAILEIEEEGTVPIRARLVERLGLSAPAVSETVNRLVDHGYAELLDDRTLRLTPKGREVAISIVRRHRLAERLLVDVIGLEWEKVHHEADRWEHAISADVEAKLVLLLGDPATCPHGNPIPGSTHKVEGGTSTPLSQSAARARSSSGASARRSRSTTARSCSSPKRSSSPGRTRSWSRAAPTACSVESDTGEQLVPKNVAQLMWVVPQLVATRIPRRGARSWRATARSLATRVPHSLARRCRRCC